jgi:hypothetical protein
MDNRLMIHHVYIPCKPIITSFMERNDPLEAVVS